jgi:hypothetical protein
MTSRERAAKVVGVLRIAAAGAWLVLFYLDWKLDPPVPTVHRLYGLIMPIFWLLWMIETWLAPKHEPSRQLPDISPARSGAGVVLATGVAAALYLGRDFHQPDDLIMPVLILLFSAGVAIAVVRFARRHAGEIGEARFDTRNRDAR